MTIAEVSPVAGAALLDEGAILLDVREADEWAAGHSARATWIALGTLADRLADVPTDRTVVCICRSGVRSLRAAELLAASGRTAVNLAGGMRAWAEAGLDVVGSETGAGTVI
jgi:rhodanese-related sulfurtransferase